MRVLYEDNHVIAVFKPHGVLVQDDATERQSLYSQVKELLREKYKKPGNVFLGLLHRLDRPVAGVVVFAKTSKAAARLSEQIRKRTVTKTYAAIVEGGGPRSEKGELVDYLIENDGFSSLAGKGQPGAKEARLFYTVCERRPDQALLRVQLITGRKHQIRLQLSQLGCPILGDKRYGGTCVTAHEGISLVCVEMVFSHPTLGTPLRIELPPELRPTLSK
jgi:23S rRNA pseudouridine1911/1915/1917 synthase